MATTTKSWTWNADAESWTATQGTMDTVARSTSYYDGASGACLYGYTNNTSASAGSFDLTSITWESLGVPAGATVTAVEVSTVKTQGGLAGWNRANYFRFDLEISLDSTWYDLFYRAVADDGSWLTHTQASKNGATMQAVNVPAGAQASDSSIALKLKVEGDCNVGSGGQVDGGLDTMSLLITYDEAGDEMTASAASTLTGKVTGSATATSTPPGSVSAAVAATLTGKVTGSATATNTAASDEMTAAVASALTGKVTCAATATNAPAGSMSAAVASALTGKVTGAATATNTAAGSMSATVASALTGKVSGAATVTNTAAGSMSAAVSVALTGKVTGSATATNTPQAGHTGAVASSLTGRVTGAATATNAPAGSMSASAASSLTGTVTASATCTNTPAPTCTATVDATLTGKVSGAATATNTAAGTMTAAVSSSLTGKVSASATVTNTAGSDIMTATVTATLTGVVTCAATATMTHGIIPGPQKNVPGTHGGRGRGGPGANRIVPARARGGSAARAPRGAGRRRSH